MNAKKYLIFTLLMLVSYNIFSQTKNNYKKLFINSISEIKTEKEYYSKAEEYFLKIENNKLPLALAEISKGMSKNAIVYNIFNMNKERLNNKVVQEEMINQLSIDTNSPEFKYVLIDFISKDIENNEELNSNLFNIAKDKTQPDWLRKYASSHIKKTENYDVFKSRLNELFETNNYSLINGTSKAVESAIKAGLSKNEENYWVEKLITKINENQDKIIELKGLVSSLGSIQSEKSKNTLLELFNQNASTDKFSSELFAYALANNADKNSINTIFSAYHKNEHFSNFGSELLLKTMANNNTNIISDLILSDDSESKINYLRAVKHLIPADRELHLSNATNCLKSKDAIIRLEAVKTLHFILPHEEEIKLFRKHAITEENQNIKNEINFYVGL